MPHDDPRRTAPGSLPTGQAETLRQIALHQETAALLHQRAERTPVADAADSLHRRAAEHAHQAQQLRADLTTRRAVRRPLTSSGGGAAGD